MRNPYDKKSSPDEYHDYASGWTRALCDRAAGNGFQCLRQWSQAKRLGYSDAYHRG